MGQFRKAGRDPRGSHGLAHARRPARLARHLSALVFRIHLIGQAVEHRGKRVPSVIYRKELMAHLPPFMQPLYDQLLEEMRGKYRARNAA